MEPKAKPTGAGVSSATPGADGGSAAPIPSDGAGLLSVGGVGLMAYHPPVKRSVTIAGHQTSISLEPAFWAALEAESRRQGLAFNALVAEVDAARLEADRPPNLTSALRQYLFGRAGDRGAEALGAAGSAVEE